MDDTWRELLTQVGYFLSHVAVCCTTVAPAWGTGKVMLWIGCSPTQVWTSILVNATLFAVFRGQLASVMSDSASSFLVGMVLWATLDGWGWGTYMLYLLAELAVSKMNAAESEVIAEGGRGARGPENVWWSAATGGICAVASRVWPRWDGSLRTGYVASLATRLSGTFASEIREQFRQRRTPAITNGVVSLAATSAGVVVPIVISGFAVAAGVIATKALPACVGAAFLATAFDRVLGASTRGEVPWLIDKVKNLITTVVGAAVGVGLGLAFGV